jgi:apolipoprotein N-acyltransferase
MDELKTVESMGFTLPSPAYLTGAIFFGIIGYAAYRYGKKTSRETTKWIGVALMLYPYLISATWLMYVVGVGLCIGLYFSNR